MTQSSTDKPVIYLFHLWFKYFSFPEVNVCSSRNKWGSEVTIRAVSRLAMKVTHPQTNAGSSARYRLTLQPPFTAGPNGANMTPPCCLFRQMLGNAVIICPAYINTSYLCFYVYFGVCLHLISTFGCRVFRQWCPHLFLKGLKIYQNNYFCRRCIKYQATGNFLNHPFTDPCVYVCSRLSSHPAPPLNQRLVSASIIMLDERHLHTE